MTDAQEEKVGMAVKVNDFLVDKATDLAGVTQIATEQNNLKVHIDNILDTDGEITADYTGVAANKKELRTALESSMRLVGSASAAYFHSINEPSKVKLSDYTVTELKRSRDSALYAKSKHLFRLADPVSASLTAFNSGPADVADLNTKSGDFLAAIQKPAEAKDYRKTAVLVLRKIFVKLEETLEHLDIYMATFEFAVPLLYLEYKNRRMQDNTGAHGTTKLDQTLNIPANTTLHIDTDAFSVEDDDVIVFINNATSVVLGVGFGADSSAIASPTMVDAGHTFIETASEAGFNVSTTYLNVRNATGAPGSFRIKVRD